MRLFHLTKRTFAGVVSCLIAGVLLLSESALCTNAYTFTPDITLHSAAAILYNQDTEQILYEKNADQQQAAGHLTQIMTAIVVMEACSDLDGTKITVNNELYAPLYAYEYADDLRYADIYNGDVLSVRELLYALMLTSSCESALVLADYFGDGEINTFVQEMNDKAAEIGCTATTFTNPTGLYDSGQLTTARDMLLITNYALQIDEFEEIATAVTFSPSISNATNHPDASAWTWTQANAMTQETSNYYYKGSKGIKTGNLTKTGRSIITEATQEGNSYLVILLNAPFVDENDELTYYHIEDATNLLNWAFQSLSYVTLLEKDEEIAEVPVMNSDGNTYVLVHPKENCVLLWCSDVDTTAVQKTIQLEKNVQAPVKAGEQLGTMELKFSGEVIATVPLVAVSNIDRSFSKFNAYALQNFPHSPWFRYGLIGGSVLTVLYIALCIYASYRAKRSVRPEDPIHLIPHVTEFEAPKKQQNWKRSETVFYHGPESHESASAEKPESEKETTGPRH